MELEIFQSQYDFMESDDPILCWIGGIGCGKAQPVDEPVLTPTGWMPIGSLKPGDKVIGGNGKPVKVVGIFPQGVKKVYRVPFNDGTWTRACADHVWTVNKSGWDNDSKRGKPHTRPWKNRTTQEIANYSDNVSIVLPNQPVVEFAPTEPPPLDPWLLGFLIGDGSFRLRDGGPSFATIDPEIIERISKDNNIKARSGCNYAIVDGGKTRKTISDLGLWYKYSHQKRIPECILRGSVEVRTEFIRGLMDADGTISKKGAASLSTSSPGLADDTAELLRSIGGIARISCKKNCGYKKDGVFIKCLPSYTVTLNSPVNPFWLERKASKWSPRTKYGQWKTFGKIAEDGESECVCIAVADEDGLYLTRGHTITHNTFCLALWVYREAMSIPGNIGIVAAATNPQLRMSTIPTFQEVFDLIGAEYQFNEWLGVFKFPNGSWFKMQSLDIPEGQLKGSTLGFLAFDEVDACPEKHIEKLIGRVRRMGASRRVRMTGNSPPPNHFLEEWFLPERARHAGKKIRGRLMQSSTYDNHLLPPDYIEKIELQYPKDSVEYRRYVMGELGVPMEGVVFKEFDKHHVIRYDQIPWERVIAYVNGLDLGWHHWTVFTRAAVTEWDEIFFFDEYACQEGYLEDHATAIFGILDNDPAGLEDDGTIYCDHDAQDRAELDRLGIHTVPAIKGDKLAGIDCIRTRLRNNKIFFVADRMPKLMSEIPYYVWNTGTEKSSGKDEPVKKNDDSIDSSRYAVSGWDLERDEP